MYTQVSRAWPLPQPQTTRSLCETCLQAQTHAATRYRGVTRFLHQAEKSSWQLAILLPDHFKTTCFLFNFFHYIRLVLFFHFFFVSSFQISHSSLLSIFTTSRWLTPFSRTCSSHLHFSCSLPSPFPSLLLWLCNLHSLSEPAEGRILAGNYLQIFVVDHLTIA